LVMTRRPRNVLILGGGFGGVTVAQEVEKAFAGDPSVRVTLVSCTNYLLFVPMLPEVASGAIEVTHILSPLRRLCPRTFVRTEVVHSIDLPNQRVTTVHPSTRERAVLEYDQLVIALGTVVDLSELPGMAQHGLPIKTIGDALQIRNQVLDMLEGADTEDDPAERAAMLTFAVAGGGFSGVEVAAELNDFVREVCKEYRNLDPHEVRVILLHSGDRILPELSTDVALYAQRKLAASGVELQLKVRLAAATAEEATFEDGRGIHTRTLVVAMGAAPNPIVCALPVEKERGQIVVNEFLEVKGQSGVWALGDCARALNPQTAQPSPPTAQFALRQARTVARNVSAQLGRGRPRKFDFTGLGQLVSLGRRKAVAEIRGLKFFGLLAWLMWRGFYLARLPGIDRKVRVLLDWTLDLPFRRDIAQLDVGRTERVAVAHYESGDDIVRQGEPSDLFHVILNGRVQVLRRSNGQEREVDQMGPGESFGEPSLLRTQRRNATVRALEPVDVLTLDRSDANLLRGHWDQIAEAATARLRRRG
jgi:NADH:ubiquinone reductase (H+-translocating)